MNSGDSTSFSVCSQRYHWGVKRAQLSLRLELGITLTRLRFPPRAPYAYVVNYSGNTVSQYAVNATTGELSALSHPYDWNRELPSRNYALSPSGAFVYVVNSSGNTISQYAVNATTGELSALSSPLTIGTGNSPNAITHFPPRAPLPTLLTTAVTRFLSMR